MWYVQIANNTDVNLTMQIYLFASYCKIRIEKCISMRRHLLIFRSIGRHNFNILKPFHQIFLIRKKKRTE